jgi:hypothetical protein
MMKYTLTTINNTRLETTQKVMAAKLTRQTHKLAMQLHLVAEIYHFQFSLQAASPDAFGYIFIHSSMLMELCLENVLHKNLKLKTSFCTIRHPLPKIHLPT